MHLKYKQGGNQLTYKNPCIFLVTKHDLIIEKKTIILK